MALPSGAPPTPPGRTRVGQVSIPEDRAAVSAPQSCLYKSQQLDTVSFLRGNKTPTVRHFVLVPGCTMMGQLGAVGLWMGQSLRAYGSG